MISPVLYTLLANRKIIFLRETTPTWCCTRKQSRIVPERKRTLRRANNYGVQKYMVLLSNVCQVSKRLPPFYLKRMTTRFLAKLSS